MLKKRGKHIIQCNEIITAYSFPSISFSETDPPLTTRIAVQIYILVSEYVCWMNVPVVTISFPFLMLLFRILAPGNSRHMTWVATCMSTVVIFKDGAQLLFSPPNLTLNSWANRCCHVRNIKKKILSGRHTLQVEILCRNKETAVKISSIHTYCTSTIPTLIQPTTRHCSTCNHHCMHLQVCCSQPV